MSLTDKMNILLVDDQPAKLLAYEAILGDLGENLIRAGSADETLQTLLKQDIGLILMDVSMPELDGFELAEVIRRHPRFQKTAIIFISGVHLTDMDRLRGYKQGAMDYISVPVVPEILRAKVGLFVDLFRKTRELEFLNRQLEERAAARTDQLRERAELLDLSIEAIMVRGLDGTIRFWNAGATKLYGWNSEEVLGQKLHEVLRTKFPLPPSQIEEALAQGKPWTGNLVQYTKQNREIVVACRKILPRDRKPPVILETCRDITSRLLAEEALRKSDRLSAMGRMAGIIAHEINNPLESITNLFYLLRNHPSLDSEARHYADTAEREISRISHITKQTLSFYRESAQAVAVSVPELLDDILELQAPQLRSSRIHIERQYSGALIVNGFPGELRQVFLNLISNAIEAMPNGGRLRVCARPASGPDKRQNRVRISIGDTGSGIDPEDAKRLFEPFFTTRSTKGTGLGLWICKGIVEKHDGRIAFRSIRSSAGNATCFSVLLPAKALGSSAQAK